MKLSIPVFFALFLVACAPAPKGFKTEDRYNVDAVYWHDGDKYSVIESKGVDITPHSCNVYGIYSDRITGMKLVADVPEGEPMFVKVKRGWTGEDAWGYYEIHVHSINDVQTAGWDHGKFGRGTTTRIQ